MKMKLTKNFLLKEDIAEQNAIFSAIENENEGEVKNLLDSGTDPNTRNELNQTPLHFAYILNADLIQTLITKGADVNAVDDSKKTPLHMASFFRDFDAMKLLLTNGANANAQDMGANTPLINFCERSNKNRYPDEGVPVENKKKCFDLLVEAKADMNLKNKRGLSPLYIAYYYEDAELVNWLIGAGADVEKEGTEIRDGIKRFIAKNKTVTESKKHIKEANEAGYTGGQADNSGKPEGWNSWGELFKYLQDNKIIESDRAGNGGILFSDINDDAICHVSGEISVSNNGFLVQYGTKAWFRLIQENVDKILITDEIKAKFVADIQLKDKTNCRFYLQ